MLLVILKKYSKMSIFFLFPLSSVIYSQNSLTLSLLPLPPPPPSSQPFPPLTVYDV